jgi:hypothetical protein
MLERDGVAKCPLYCGVVEIDSVMELPKSFTTLQVLEELRQRRSMAQNRIAESGGPGSGLCDFCEELHAASHRCLNCAQNMCPLVTSFHRKTTATKDHPLEELDLRAEDGCSSPESSASDNVRAPPSVCLRHNKAYEFYDQHCRATVCSSCVIADEHRSHKCVTLDVAAAESRATLGRLEVAATALATELKTAGDGVVDAIDALDKFCQSEEKSLNSDFQEVRSWIVGCEEGGAL